MSLNHGPKINYNNLMVYLDAGNPKSYPGSGNTWYDLSGNGKNATLYNNPTFSQGALIFDGTASYGTIPSILLNGDCTIEFAFKHFHNFVGDKYFLNSTSFYVHFRGDWAGNNMYLIRRTNGTDWYGQSAWGTTTGVYHPVPNNEISHIVFSQDNGTGQFKTYKNGVNTNTVNGFHNNATGTSTGYNGLNAVTANVTISSGFYTNVYFIKIYNTVLTPTQVQQNFKAVQSRLTIV